LVAFADLADRVTAAPADRLTLSVHGPFADGQDGPGSNLILSAIHASGTASGLRPPPLAATLEQRLPVAAGLGGGSSDVGAALKLARDILAPDLDDAALAGIAAVVGADGPMRLHARTAWAEGRGDRLDFEPGLPPSPAVLVNPGVAPPTGAVYAAY